MKNLLGQGWRCYLLQLDRHLRTVLHSADRRILPGQTSATSSWGVAHTDLLLERFLTGFMDHAAWHFLVHADCVPAVTALYHEDALPAL